MSISFSVIVDNEGGLHARPSGILVQYIVLNDLDVMLSYMGRDVNADSVLDMMSLCIPKGGEINIQVTQDDHGACGLLSIEQVEQDIKKMFVNHFGLKM